MKIAYGKSCNAKVWKNNTIDWSDLCTKFQTTVRTSETVAEYQKMSKPDKKKAKDRGGLVGGFLQDGRRGKENVKSRSMLTLDNDNAEHGFIERFGSECEYAAVLYTNSRAYIGKSESADYRPVRKSSGKNPINVQTFN